MNILTSTYCSKENSVINVKNLQIRAKSASIKPGDILQNEAFKRQELEPRIGYKVTWLKSRSNNSSKHQLSCTVTNTQTDKGCRKKHYLTSPFGFILKGKKLKQRYGVGSIFRENFENNPKSMLIRNDLNMRSKWK